MTIIWELDFYSRPILDDQQKKIWEVLICESPLGVNANTESLFRFSQFCPIKEANSLGLAKMIQEAIDQSSQRPEKIRFFRRQMANMITRACEELNIPSSLSRRTFTLWQWFQDRIENVYPTYPNFQPGTNPSVQYAEIDPKPLPDALIGQKWAIVSLTAADLMEMGEWEIDFSEAFPLSLMGIAPETKIPGLIIFSPRANALAAWMSGLELGCIKLDQDQKPRLLLESGTGDRWILANLTNPNLQKEAANFEEAKTRSKQVHFLAIQSKPDVESFAGFWLMQELNVF